MRYPPPNSSITREELWEFFRDLDAYECGRCFGGGCPTCLNLGGEIANFDFQAWQAIWDKDIDEHPKPVHIRPEIERFALHVETLMQQRPDSPFVNELLALMAHVDRLISVAVEEEAG